MRPLASLPMPHAPMLCTPSLRLDALQAPPEARRTALE